MKFDDLISQIYNIDLEEHENRTAATDMLEKNLRNPLFASRFPPKAHVCLEGMHFILFFQMISISWYVYA